MEVPGQTLKISVITVVRNDADGMAKTMASVAAQTHPTIEYIVIDGASLDGTAQVIRRNQHSVHHWRSEPDAGLYDAMNKGRALATGDYALFLNSGDTFAAPDALARLFATPVVRDTILCGNIWLAHGSRTWKVPATTAGQVPPGYLPHHQTIFYPRAFYATESYDLFFRVMGDVDFTARAARRFPIEYRDVDLVRTTLGGYTFQMCGTWKGVRQMLRERLEIVRRYRPDQSWAATVIGCAALSGKGLAVKIGGVKTATLLMEWKHRLNVFRWSRLVQRAKGGRQA